MAVRMKGSSSICLVPLMIAFNRDVASRSDHGRAWNSTGLVKVSQASAGLNAAERRKHGIERDRD
jgi:hypothetical protein